MMKTIFAFIVCISILAATNVYAGYDEDIAAINKDMPKPVQQFNNRQIECNHWAGEEPYDKERLEEINAATKKLNCNNLKKDELKLLKKYKSRPDVAQSIKKAKEFI
jgi:hypothetical protein